MKKHNKFLTLVLVVMMALAMVALAACADQQATNDNPEDNQTAEGDTRIFTDLTGAEVELPTEIDSVIHLLSLIHIS